MVAGRGLTLVGSLMLLIDDDESQIGKRRKKRRSCADHNIRLAVSGPLKLVALLTGRKPGMHDTDAASKTAIEAAHGLVGQGNLRNQHDHLFSLLKHIVNQSHVDFGLAAARDTVNETGPAVAEVIGSNEGVRDGLLLGI